MKFVAWEIRLNEVMVTGGSQRDHLQDAASRGNAFAIAMLRGPPKPRALRYLYRLHRSLQRGLGEGMNGRAALTWTAFDAWARSMRIAPLRPSEVSALFDLDAVARDPTIVEKLKL